jgi:hypothetical protein
MSDEPQGIDPDTLTPAQGSPGDTLTRRQVADACRVSLRTVSRWLDAHELEGAHQDTDGVWRIPRAAILGRLPKGAPGEAPPAPGPPPAKGDPENADELERLRRENTELRHRLEVEATARSYADAALEDARLALRALAAGTPTDTPTPAPTPDPVNTHRRRWWSR